MRKSLMVLVLAGMVLLACSTSFGTSFVITNDDNCAGTSSTSSIYTLTSGILTPYPTQSALTTGGLGNCGGFFATVGNAVTQNANCLFVADGGTSDIAAFARTGVPPFPLFTKVPGPNFTDSHVIAGFPGGSMALTPNGRFLYETYAASENIGAWKVNTNCSLTFVAAYQAVFGVDTYSNLIVDPTGIGLIVSVDDLGGLEAFKINGSTGALTDVGSTNLNSTSCASIDGCFPTGLDITKTELLVVGNATFGASGFTTQLTASSPFFTNVQYHDLTNSANMVNNEVPWLSNAAYNTGSGALYWGFSGFGAGEQPGVLTTALSSSGAVTVGAATAINSPNDYDGTIQSTGNWMVVSEWFNQLQVFQINANGSLTATSQGPVTDANANGALSFFIFPKTR